MDNKIQALIKKATDNLQNSSNKDAKPSEKPNIKTSTDNIKSLLANWQQNLQQTINNNINNGGISINIPNTETKKPNSSEEHDFIQNRMNEIMQQSRDLSNDIQNTYQNLHSQIPTKETPVSSNTPQTTQEIDPESTPTQKMEGVKLLSKSKVRVLADELRTKVFGQDDIISSVVTTLKSAALNIKINKEKPAGCYLFAGPSGVGKTELGVSIAEALGVPILKINMGEYSLEQDITKLIGTSKGYVGYKEGGLLTNFVRDNPACVILLDELEKAHSSIDKPLLSIMDHGICTDNTGQDISFRETIVISTSNLGADVEYYGDSMTKKEKDDYRMNIIKSELRPEIINRYDGIFHFNALTPEIYSLITKKFLNKLHGIMLEEHNYELKFSQKLIDFIVEKSYDPAMGGRPARRFIEQIVTNPLTDVMLADEFSEIIEQHPVITMDLNKDGNIYFKGTKNKNLGVEKNTAEIVARAESAKFTKMKEQESIEQMDLDTTPVKVLKSKPSM